jgi:hypothetical protein
MDKQEGVDCHCRKTLFSFTSMFVNLSETMAEFGFLVRLSWLQSALFKLVCCYTKGTLRDAKVYPGLQQALAAAMVAFGILYLRHLYTISPDAVYRKALIQLNTNPGILEVCIFPAAKRAQPWCRCRSAYLASQSKHIAFQCSDPACCLFARHGKTLGGPQG